MRRLLVVPLLALGLVAGSAQVAVGEDHRPKLPAQASERASVALAAAREAMRGEGEATLALAELRASYSDLSAPEKRQADALFARPTDGAGDPGGDGYNSASTSACGNDVCVHYVWNAADADAPPQTDRDVDGVPDWVETNVAVMQQVWSHQVDALGYRQPYTDGAVGGNEMFDVYLKDIGAQGLYGYCVPETPVDPFDDTDYRASGYCVLDDDFAEFPKPGLPSLRVTAAHEFFHAIQFGYDYAEDPWIMESTATWIEERFADDVDDNRGYLRWGQLGNPGLSLDTYGGAQHYGNWIFFELLSKVYGVGAVKALWTRMDSAHGEARDQYSTQAIRTFLASKRMPFPKFYARFAAGNLVPERTYTEGAAYRPAPITAGYKLTSGTKSTGKRTPRVNHLASKNYRFVADASLRGTWRLKVNVDLPAPGTGSAAYLIVHRKDGSKAHRQITLNRYGNATAYVGFSRSTVAAVTLTLANGSTRFKDCWLRQTPYSCSGSPLDSGRVYGFKATAVR